MLFNTLPAGDCAIALKVFTLTRRFPSFWLECQSFSNDNLVLLGQGFSAVSQIENAFLVIDTAFQELYTVLKVAVKGC